MKLGTGLGFKRSRKLKTPTLLSLPATFLSRWTPTFNIYESGRTYSTDFNFDALKPTGTTKWVSKTGNDTTGTGTEGNPYRTLAKAYTDGAVVVKVGAGLWTRTDGFTSNFNPNRNFTVESSAGAGQTIITRAYDGLTWTQQSSPNDNVYLATIPISNGVTAIVDLSATGRSGEFLKDGTTPVPIPLSVQTSIANCQANAGSYFVTGTSLYVRTHDGRAPDASVITLSTEAFMWFTAPNTNVTFCLDGLEIWGVGGVRTEHTVANTNVLGVRNSALRFSTSTLALSRVQGTKQCYFIGCEASDHPNTDAFSYATVNVAAATCNALEVNCKARRLGKTGSTNNFNAFTSHNHANVIRLNGDGQFTVGPCTVDVLGSYSINLGMTSGNSQVSTNINAKCGYQVGTVSDFDSVTTSKMWFKNCNAVGQYFDWGQSSGGELFDWGGNIGETGRTYGIITTYP